MFTEVYLLSVPLDKDYKHTFYFGSPSAQKGYFDSKVKHSFTDFTYQRKDNTIRIPIDYDRAIKCNYVMYQNTSESSKWFYAFITDYMWSDEDTTTITIQTDVLQTYAFDYTVLTSFVEREHCSDDTIGANTYPENLECGEFVCKYRDSVTELQDCAIVIGVTDRLIAEGWESVQGNRYDGIYSGIQYLWFTADDITGVNGVVQHYASEGRNESLKCIFMYPISMLNVEVETPRTISVTPSEKPKKINKTFSKSGSSSYTPRNQKLHTFPYQYLLVTNNNGGSAVYQFEHFETQANSFPFVIKGSVTPGGSIRLIPKNYKGLAENDEEGFNLGKYPICNWTSDEYTNWLTQNSVNIGLNIASGVGQIVAGVGTAVATGGLGTAVGGGMVAGGVSTITNQLAQIHQMSFTSSQSRGNLNCGDVITADNKNTFFFQYMSIKDEYMKIIDNFFDMFGYKCNRVKVPEKNHREHWWFTKTIDANITGDIPQNDLETIKNCYNAGVTFWKDDIKNYARNNAII